MMILQLPLSIFPSLYPISQIFRIFLLFVSDFRMKIYMVKI